MFIGPADFSHANWRLALRQCKRDEAYAHKPTEDAAEARAFVEADALRLPSFFPRWRRFGDLVTDRFFFPVFSQSGRKLRCGLKEIHASAKAGEANC